MCVCLFLSAAQEFEDYSNLPRPEEERLTAAEKADYDTLVKRLTEEFTDNHERRLFNENMEYNKRKKGQKLKDFMQDIKKDMNRYSGYHCAARDWPAGRTCYLLSVTR